MPSFYSTSAPGLEDVAAKEIEELGGKITRLSRGRVYFEGDIGLVATLNYWGRTIERAVLLLKECKVEGLEEIYREVRELDFSIIKPHQSFAVRSKRVGFHDFTSIDIARVAGQAVIDSYLASKAVRLKVNLNEPDVIVRVELIDHTLLVGIDTTGDEGLHKRGYRVYQHPAPLNATIAASMIRLSAWRCHQVLVDPMCGSGTILVEAAMMARNVPPGKFRKDFAFTRIFGDELLEEVRYHQEKGCTPTLIGIERFEKHIRGARQILEFTGFDFIKLIRGDATRLDEYLELDRVDVLITNPPYGLRIGKKGIIHDLYSGFICSAYKVLRNGGRIVMITPEKELVRSLAENAGYSVEERPVSYGGIDAGIFILRKVYYRT
jgi:tRNA (guanine6-N2)-methyltransferase